MIILSGIWKGLKWIAKLFASDAAKHALALADEFIPQVKPVVDAIYKLVPSVGSATLADIKAVYTSFGKTLGNIEENPVAFGEALASLSLAVVRERLGDDSTPSRILELAIKLALVLVKS